MELARMRLILGRYLGLEGGLDSTDADEALNANYQFALPNLIGGAILEGHIDIVTVASTGDYDFDAAGLAMATPVISKNVFRPVVNTANGNFLQVSDQPVSRGHITYFLGAPTEDLVQTFDSVVVDGGRKRGVFNADWHEVSRSLSEDYVRRLAGLPPREEEGGGDRPGGQRPRRSRLGKLISLEVTD